MTALFFAYALSFAASLAVESFPPGLASLRAPARALLFRLALHTGLFAAAFALSWRPWHAALVVVVIAFLFGLGSAVKRRILGEPLVFTDFALVRLAVRHPRLYYAERLAEPRALALFATLAVATVAWFALERPILPHDGLALIAVPPLVALGVAWGLRTPAASRAAREIVGPAPDAERDLARFGLGASLLLHGMGWMTQERPSCEARAAIAARPAIRPAREGPDVVVAIQCESFVDIVSRGVSGPELPAYRRLSRESLAWGRCRVTAEGAYTMRSEFGFLTGLPAETLGYDLFDPYLFAADYAPASLARRFAASGRRTLFLHPYDRRFFGRDERVGPLGFDGFVDGGAFVSAERFGPYVSDASVADAIVAEVAATREKLFLFAVTIENHGPWGPGRLPGCDDPAGQYARHLVNADRMIGRVAEELAARPGGGLLCLYGDHAPARTLHPGLPDRRETDYLVWDSRRRAAAESARRDMTVDELGRTVASLA